jgi:hypothetical protein
LPVVGPSAFIPFLLVGRRGELLEQVVDSGFVIGHDDEFVILEAVQDLLEVESLDQTPSGPVGPILQPVTDLVGLLAGSELR